MRGERVDEAAHGVPVLVEVFDTGCQGERRLAIGVGVGTPGDGAGEHTRGDGAARDRHEGLGARADEAVHGVDPRVGVARGERAHEAAEVRPGGHGAGEVACEHDLADLARGDRREARAHGVLIALGGERARADRRRPVRAERHGDRFGRVGRTGIRQHPRRPRAIACVTDREPRHREHGGRCRVRGERQRPERDEARAGRLDVIVDVRGGGDLAPAVGERGGIGARGGEGQGVADADEPRAAPAPDERIRGVGVFEQVAERRDLAGHDAESCRRGGRVAHVLQPNPERSGPEPVRFSRVRTRAWRPRCVLYSVCAPWRQRAGRGNARCPARAVAAETEYGTGDARRGVGSRP